VIRLGIGVLLLVTLSGCQSVRSWSRCPGIYSGVRYYGDQLQGLPFDGKVFFTLDLPLTALTDTLAVPITAFADREMPRGGYPIGCRWAQRR